MSESYHQDTSSRIKKESLLITGYIQGQTSVRFLPAASPAVDASEKCQRLKIRGDVAIRIFCSSWCYWPSQAIILPLQENGGIFHAHDEDD